MAQFVDITGSRYGHLVVTGRAVKPHHIKSGTYWQVHCLRCGRYNVVNGSSLKSGCTKSCGCLRDSYQAHVKSGIPYKKEDF